MPFLKKFKSHKEKYIWLSCVVFVSMIILTIVCKKKVYYFLPALPFMSILGARFWLCMISFSTSCRSSSKLWKILTGLVFLFPPLIFIVLGCISILYGLFGAEMEKFRIVIFLLGILLCIMGGIGLYLNNRVNKKWAGMLLVLFSATVFNLSLFSLVIPNLTRMESFSFAEKVASAVGNNPLVFFVEKDDTLLFYLHRNIPSIMNANELKNIFEKDLDCFVLAKKKRLSEAMNAANSIVVLHTDRFRDNSIPFFGHKSKSNGIYLLRLEK